MTTAKEKAEAYVRSKIPELMELSFGCEIDRHAGEGIQEYFISDAVGEISLMRRNKFGDWQPFQVPNELKESWGVIGHPIQLHHWLRVLPKKNMSISATAHFLYVDYKGDRGMTFDLVTGQPDSEPSYKNFLTIVGEDKELTD